MALPPHQAPRMPPLRQTTLVLDLKTKLRRELRTDRFAGVETPKLRTKLRATRIQVTVIQVTVTRCVGLRRSLL
jgi:hypothetical protein